MELRHTHRGGGRFCPKRQSFIFMSLCLILIKLDPVFSLRDDWYGFVSFKDSSEFKTAYEFTCAYHYDLFREPLEFSRRNDLRGRGELHTPIRFYTRDTVPADTNVTLHIYNNPAIRGGFSVSYGFQRNKECLHGRDTDCVVVPELGRVRALVLNAERFSGKYNLNYIKDHFLVEKPERFVSILNGGSNQERKFYEAVFLGGYSNDVTRSSHRIDDKIYPLEIYMFFLDETVPSVSLSTILVVLVEESDHDNHLIKPIVNAVEYNLYDAERRFLENNKAVIRRERLFHHLQSSTYYDVYDREKSHERGLVINQESLESTIKHEALFTRFVELFEKLQALETELFFFLEDRKHVNQLKSENEKIVDGVFNRTLIKYVPTNFTEYQLLTWATLYRGLIFARNKSLSEKHPTCRNFTDYYIRDLMFFVEAASDRPSLVAYKNNTPTGEHLEDFLKLVTAVCDHFDKNFKDLYDFNNNNTLMRNINNQEKYWLIEDHLNERKKRDEVNKMIKKHFHGNPDGTSKFHNYSKNEEKPEYESTSQAGHIADGIHALYYKRVKKESYRIVSGNISKEIRKVVDRFKFTDETDMMQTIKIIKQGNKQNDLKFFRHDIHEKLVTRNLPVQQKKRTLVELGGMEISDADLNAYEELNPVKAMVNDQFQISWLIPPDGGYYYYSGSSPVPPCFRAQNVIVFKKPIKMSRRQIEILTRVPTSFDRDEDIHFTTPRVHDTWFEVELKAPDTDQPKIEEVNVPVYDQKRNHLFLGHDGIQQNAVKLWNDILERSKITAAGIKRKGSGMAKVVMVGLAVGMII